jgi:hypothetical protein
MSNTSVKVALALFVVSASPAASFAQPAGSVASGNVPITTVDRGGVGKCFQRSPAIAAAQKPAKIVPSTRVCWAPPDPTDGPEV